MKKLLFLLASFLFLVPQALANQQATVINLVTGHRIAINVGSPFPKGYTLETSSGYKLDDSSSLGYSVVSAYRTSLSQPMTSTQTSIPVSSLVTKDGHTLTMSDLGNKVFLTIEPGGAKEEIVMCTSISGSSWATCTRGLAFYGTSTVSVQANQKTHSAGSTITISNVHYVYEQLTDLEKNQTIAGVKTFTSSPIVPTPSTDTQAANKSYVDGVAIAGGANASQSVKGISKLSSDPSVTTNPTALNSEEVSATSSANKVPRADANGDLNESWVKQDGTYNWSGSNTWSGTSTFNGTTNFTATTTVSTSTPTLPGQVIGLDASSKLPAVDGSQLTGIGLGDSYYMGAGSSTANKLFYNYRIPFVLGSGVTSGAIWAESGTGSSYNFNYGTAPKTTGAGGFEATVHGQVGIQINFGSKKIITEFSTKLNSVGTNDVGFGLSDSTGARQLYNDATHKAVLFSVSPAGNLYAHTSTGGGGSNHTETQITGITLTNENTYRIEYNPGVNALFYVNGTLKATITTNLPTTSGSFIGFGSTSTTDYCIAVSSPYMSIEK